MAAPPSSNTSPSQQKLKQQDPPAAAPDAENANTKDPPASMALKKPPPPAPQASAATAEQYKITDFASALASPAYKLAQDYLQTGAFDQALEVLEDTFESSFDDNDDPLHPARAPFHYLYGTILLYQVEEAPESSNAPAMGGAGLTTLDGSAAANAAASAPQDEDEGPEVNVQDAIAAMAAAAAALPSEDDQAANNNNNNNADELELAWEHLDVARTIVTKLLSSTDTSSSSSLQAYLAQICLREGDLQRMNGNYVAALEDYQASLNAWSLAGSHAHARKWADVQYNMGLCHLTYSSELSRLDVETTVEGDQKPAASDDKQALIAHHCQQGLEHYAQSAQGLARLIADVCGVSADKEFLGPPAAGAAAATTTDPTAQTVTLLQKLQAYQDMPPDAASLVEVVQEIVETMQEATSSLEAVRQASELKLQAQAAAVAGETNTQIGFDAPTMTTTAVAAAAAPPTMMVVKKKKKREAADNDEDNDRKPAAVPNAKRAKSE